VRPAQARYIAPTARSAPAAPADAAEQPPASAGVGGGGRGGGAAAGPALTRPAGAHQDGTAAERRTSKRDDLDRIGDVHAASVRYANNSWSLLPLY
jgi:hypothetical protein